MCLGVSAQAFRSNRQKAYQETVRASGDVDMIRAYREDGINGLAIDLSTLDVVFHDPETFFKQMRAAVVDGAILYSVKEGVESINRSSSSTGDNSINVTVSNGTANVTIISNGETANQDDIIITSEGTAQVETNIQ